MEQRGPRIPEYKLDIFTDPASAKEIVKGILHTIFFHRYFLPITPMCRDVLDLTLPVVEDDDLETLIDQRATSVVRALETPPAGYAGNSSNGQSRVQVVLQFCETKRKKSYFFGSAEDQICWEQWILDVACARPKTDIENRKVRLAMETSLQKAATKIVTIVNRDLDHIPPITVRQQNPFPYQIHVNLRSDNWGQRMSIF